MALASKVAEGMAILAALDGSAECDAQHDELACGGPPPDELTDELRKQLEDSGWFWNEEYECWSLFT